MQKTHTPGSHDPPDRETLELWYALGKLYADAAPARYRAARLGFTVTLVAGAAVLLSAPIIGTSWAGPFAPLVPVVLGLVAGVGMFLLGRRGLRREERSIRQALLRRGWDPERPASGGLDAYYDPQLVLLRSEYEYLLRKGATRSSRLFERAFGFLPEDPFETGPLNVRPETEEMRSLRRRWDRRLQMISSTSDTPAMGLREDLAYRVFPREMTVPAEMATKEAYLTVSISLVRQRYGRSLPESGAVSEGIKRDYAEYARLNRRTSPQPPRGARSGRSPEGRS